MGCRSKIMDRRLSQRHTKGTRGRKATQNSWRRAPTRRSRFSFFRSRKWNAPDGLPDLEALDHMTYYVIQVWSTPKKTKMRHDLQNKNGHSDLEPNQWWRSNRVSCKNKMHRHKRNCHSAKLLVHRARSHRKKLCNFLSGQWIPRCVRACIFIWVANGQWAKTILGRRARREPFFFFCFLSLVASEGSSGIRTKVWHT